MRRIISASRRTDIPAFFSDWLLRRLEAGHCTYWHPFSRRWFEVSLAPQDVAGIVLWTKNIGPLLPHLATLRRSYPLYVQFTITGHNTAVERGVIPPDEAVEQARALSAELGPESLIWRYDPIVFTQHSDPEEALARFERLSGELSGYTRRCTISFMSPYRRQRRAFEQAGLQHHEPTQAQRVELSQALAHLASERGMTLEACCQGDLVQGAVLKAHCVDAHLLAALGAEFDGRAPAAPSRPGCGCSQSIDIGAYDLCGGGCAYCYANQDHGLAMRNLARHDPAHQGLAEAYLPAPAGPLR